MCFFTSSIQAHGVTAERIFCVQGEITVVIEGMKDDRSGEPSASDIEAELRRQLSAGLSASSAAKAAAAELGCSKSLVYPLSITIAAESSA